jgi:hypothetical protein
MDQAIACLSEGAMYVHLVDEGPTCYEFAARPVYLPASAHLHAVPYGTRGGTDGDVPSLPRRRSA